ncbi:unnamed protein product [Staurois parvus]|uniref:Uncharacterized protein n=1 Tax=Staurois parvus TaxID=386267 RepID=A0ABN9EFA2_9NEOB|nr:unnamed protein product [Staurois parvus]
MPVITQEGAAISLFRVQERLFTEVQPAYTAEILHR